MCPIRPSDLGEFERGRRTGREEERALIPQRLHKGFECISAAAFAIELAKELDTEQSEFISRASRLLTEAIELLRGVADLQKGNDLRSQSEPKYPPKDR